MSVLLATCADWPTGEPNAAALDAALADRGIDARWERWDDPAVDWAGAELVGVRSTWDYFERVDEFVAWAQLVEKGARLLNGADVFAWNVDKAYLARLGDLPVVPTTALEGRDSLADAVAAVGGPAVVKPRVSASGIGVVVVDGPDDPRLADVADVPLVVQPLVESIRTVGEQSVFVIDGRPLAQVSKVPAAGEIRAHEHRGAVVGPVPLDGELAALAVRATEAAAAFTGRPLDYARIDLLRWQGAWCVGELELTEPGLYLDVLPANADAYADLVAARLR